MSTSNAPNVYAKASSMKRLQDGLYRKIQRMSLLACFWIAYKVNVMVKRRA